jgi:hypothetical protein
MDAFTIEIIEPDCNTEITELLENVGHVLPFD